MYCHVPHVQATPSKEALKGKSHQLGSNPWPWITAKLADLLALVSHICNSSGCALYMHLSVMPVCHRCHFQMSNVCHRAVLKPCDSHGNQITAGTLVTQLPLCDPNGKGRAAETYSLREEHYSVPRNMLQKAFFNTCCVNVGFEEICKEVWR